MNSEYRVTHMGSSDWKLPLNLAVGFHILVLLSSIYLPGLFKAKPKFADIYTVSIINVAEPEQPPAPPPAPKASPPEPVVKEITAPPVTAKKLAPIAEPEPQANVPVAPVKAVSLKPLKKKIVKKTVTPEVTVKPKVQTAPKKDDLAKKRRQELAEAIREEELLAERAKLAREALEMEKNLLQTSRISTPAASSTESSTSRNETSTKTSESNTSQVEKMYYAALTNRLMQFWALPETMQKQPNLLSTVVITINKNGQIADFFFEDKSGNRVFDQFVTKTISAANPMPAIPAALRKQRFEIGLNFRPGGIQ